jgi:adenosylhomocysteine nucleosidase
MAIADGAGVLDRVEADVLAVAAEEREFAGLLSRAQEKRRLAGWPVECAWWAVTGAVRWLLVSDGPGASLAGRAAAEALSRASVRCILSTGLCGALDARWKPGDVVHAAEVIDGQGTRWESLDPGAGTEPVRLLSVGRVAATIDEKRGLAVATGAAVVEMEAAAVAAEAARNGLPFYCLRAVSDGLEEELPMDFNRYRDSKGRFSRLRIAAACALRPWAVPALLRFDRQCRWSAGILGDYLVHARFA